MGTALEDQGLGCLRIVPIKVRAHADKTMAAFLQQAPHHTFGNMVADTLAGRGASFLHEVAVGPTFQAHAVDLRARLVMRRLGAITLQDVAANPRAKTKGLTAKAKREARLAERPRWLYQRRRRNGESGLDEGAARLPEAEPSDHEQLTLGELFGPEEDEFLAWGLFSPEPEEPRLADEPVVEAVSGHVRSSAGFATQAGSSSSASLVHGLLLYSAGLATQASAAASSTGAPGTVVQSVVQLGPVEDVVELALGRKGFRGPTFRRKQPGIWKSPG